MANVGAVGLVLNGDLSGAVGLTKTGIGDLDFTTANFVTYTGTTRVNAGVLRLFAFGFNGGLNGPLIISDGSASATVRLLIDHDIPNFIAITINAGGVLDLNNFNEDIGPNLTLNNGGSIQSYMNVDTFCQRDG